MGFKDMALYQDMTSTLFQVALFSSLGAFSFGYDNSWWGGALGAVEFNRKFGSAWTPDATTGELVHILSSTEKSSGTALGTAGIMIGCLIAPYINERYGRRIAFVSLGVTGIVGTLIQACSTINHAYWVLIAGKIIVNASVGIASSVTGIYQAECAPKRIRGALINFYTVVQNFGNLLGNGIVLGVNDRSDSLVWMLPIGIQFIFPVIIAAGSMFLPESPRWLVSKGRTEDAVQTLRRLRGPLVDAQDLIDEAEEMRASYEHEKSLSESTSWVQLFRGTDLRRTLIAIGVQCLQQGQGISFMGNYLIITLIGLGFTNAFELLMICSSAMLVLSLLGFYLPDRIGRRVLLLGGSTAMLFSMLTVAAVATVSNNHPTGALARLTLGAVFIWMLVFSFTWSPMPWTVSSEVSSNRLRDKTLAASAWSGFAVGLITNFVVPYIQDAGYGNLQGRIGYIWAGFSVFSIFFCYFFVPELKGRSLEEIDVLFQNKVSTLKFPGYQISTSELRQKQSIVSTTHKEAQEA